MPYIYREATLNDARALLLHLETVGGETDNLTFGKEGFRITEEREARFIERFRKNPDEVMYVVKYCDTVVANAVIERERIPRLSHRARLTLTVLRAFWGQGIGSRLMEMMINFAKDTGAAVISLECRADNERAVSLYTRFGFRTVGTMERYFNINGEYHSAYLMELLL